MTLLFLLLSCTVEPELLTGIENPTGGDPLVPEVALYPFPSDYFLEDGRVALPQDGLPDGFTSETFADSDGFSRITPILAWLEGGFSGEGLPGPDDAGDSVADDAPILLVSEHGERVPYLAEPDARAEKDSDQTLIIRPVQALDAATRYAVLLTSDVRRADGSAHVAPDAFAALRDGVLTDNDDVEAWRDDFELVNAAIAESGRDPSEFVLGWSFTTRSEESVTGPAIALQEAAGAWELEPWQLVSDTVEGNNRLIEGTFIAPDYLDDTLALVFDDNGQPVQQGTREVPFTLTIPVTVTEARPITVFGHGFFWSRVEASVGTLNADLQDWRMSAITVDFLGFCEDDLTQTLSTLLTDIDHTYSITSQQLQSQLHLTLLGRLVDEQLADDVLGDDGQTLLDRDNIPYSGISNGGTQGLTLMSTTPFFTRGALIVGAGGWSHFIERATQWNTVGEVFSGKYGGQIEVQQVLGLVQHELDGVDAMNFVEHLVTDRYAHTQQDVRITLHEAVGDCQVPNFMTEATARTAGIPLATPSPRDVFGLDTISAEDPGYDGNAALLIYDLGYEPPPDVNLGPEEDNGAHSDVRKAWAYDEQVGAFLEDGTIVQVCDGACDPD